METKGRPVNEKVAWFYETVSADKELQAELVEVTNGIALDGTEATRAAWYL